MQASAAPGGYAGAAPGFGAGGAYASSAGRVLAAKGGGIDAASIELPEKVRQAIEEKCERVRSYMVPDKPMRGKTLASLAQLSRQHPLATKLIVRKHSLHARSPCSKPRGVKPMRDGGACLRRQLLCQ
eukprot:TRINITY_DN2089_c0_g1_i3.p1 TRINITY_DN2089_c0_g1~~TRINITY_DN2089_c0_g1_i3.p1  ORF type:complete len:128 (-),score=3.22 TRINITY_DN2089_c0_g1_i3:199-582(-)